jgi:hypothetical protein
MKLNGIVGNGSRGIAMAAVTLALAATPLTACSSGQPTKASSSSESTAQMATTDSSSWKRVSDVPILDSAYSWGYDDTHFVCVLEADGTYYRIIVKLDDEANKRIEEIIWDEGDVEKQTLDAIADLPLERVEDLSVDMLSPEELDALVGKTGQELVDAGFVFESYFMYGGQETGATFDKGSLAYAFTFDTSVAEDAVEDGGQSVMGAHVVSAEASGAANSATDPSTVS